ncbi:hypothetical protein FRB99_007289 [Tulasnella sp. 403]|nr:hypothetical protein FRB99_007289 [Tulasnella sp. 403]
MTKSHSNDRQGEPPVYQLLPPIHRLPIELLQSIFQHVVATSGTLVYLAKSTLSHYKPLHTLRRVCTRWATIVDSSAFLWTLTSSGDPFKHTDKALNISSQSLLDVIYRDDDFTEARLTAYIARLTPHSHRWRYLTLYLINKPKILKALFEAPAPKLDDLFIFAYATHILDLAPLVPSFFTGVHPKLRSITLMNVSIPWKHADLKNLVQFHLSGVPVVPDVGRMLAILSASPAMRRFQIDRVHPEPVPEITLWDMQAKLPQMQFFVMKGVPTVAGKQILGHVLLPTTAVVRTD